MKDLTVYHADIPSYLKPYLDSAAMQRLKGIDMNCGMNFTSFLLFKNCEPYSRYEHSLGVALIIAHFTQDTRQSLAGLFHDISTPAFSHVIDFVNQDYLNQESTEYDTVFVIKSDPLILAQLEKDHMDIQDVSNYHRYPIADNDSPRLSADRLEYTLSNAFNYHLATMQEIETIYQDICIMQNEDNMEELGFQHDEIALHFTKIALECGKIYSCQNDRYAMEKLAILLRKCMKESILSKDDLMQDEMHVIRILKSSRYAKDWGAFCLLSHVEECTKETNGSLRIAVKKRYIDPLCADGKRVRAKYAKIENEISEFLQDEMDVYLKGDTY